MAERRNIRRINAPFSIPEVRAIRRLAKDAPNHSAGAVVRKLTVAQLRTQGLLEPETQTQ